MEDADDDEEIRFKGTENDKEGERRGRKAFMGIRYLLEDVRLKNEAFQGWVTEMVDAGLMGTI